jgi:hypothetical protein
MGEKWSFSSPVAADEFLPPRLLALPPSLDTLKAAAPYGIYRIKP